MIYVLIQADEGSTADIFVATSPEGLNLAIEEGYAEEIMGEELDCNIRFYNAEKAARLQMLREHKDWSPGRYTLENIEPEWQEWTLCIVKEDHIAL